MPVVLHVNAPGNATVLLLYLILALASLVWLGVVLRVVYAWSLASRAGSGHTGLLPGNGAPSAATLPAPSLAHLFLAALGPRIFHWDSALCGLSTATLLLGVCCSPFLFRVSVVSLDRLALGATALVLLWAVRNRRATAGRWHKGDLALAMWMAWIIASTLTHDWTALDGFPLSTLIFFYLVPTVFYGIARFLPWSPQHARRLAVSLILLSIYLTVMALAEMTQQRWAVFPKYIVSPAYPEFLGRGRGPLLNPVANGFFLNLGLMCTVLAWPWLGLKTRLCLVPLSVALLAGCYATLTRSVWIGAAGSLFVIGFLTIPARYRLPLMVGGMLCGLLVVTTQWERLTSFKRDENVSVADMESSASLRPILATIGLKMFQDYPWAGVGFGQYLEHNAEYTSVRTHDLPLEKGRPYIQHNIFLSVLVETGLVGLVLYLSTFGSWLWAAGRLWFSPTAPLVSRQLGLLVLAWFTFYCANGMFHELSVIPMVNMATFFACGLTVRESLRQADERHLGSYTGQLRFSSGSTPAGQGS